MRPSLYRGISFRLVLRRHTEAKGAPPEVPFLRVQNPSWRLGLHDLSPSQRPHSLIWSHQRSGFQHMKFIKHKHGLYVRNVSILRGGKLVIRQDNCLYSLTKRIHFWAEGGRDSVLVSHKSSVLQFSPTLIAMALITTPSIPGSVPGTEAKGTRESTGWCCGCDGFDPRPFNAEAIIRTCYAACPEEKPTKNCLLGARLTFLVSSSLFVKV